MPQQNEAGFKPSSPADRGDFLPDDTPVLDEVNTDVDDTDTSADADDGDDSANSSTAEQTDGEKGTDAPSDEAPDDKSDDGSDSGDDDNSDDNRIPRSRLKKEVDKRKALEQELRELKASQKQRDEPKEEKAPEPAVSVEEFKKMQLAMLDEDTDTAFELFQKMLDKSAERASATARDDALSSFEEKQQNEKLAARANELSKSYPELDNASDDRDENLIEEVVAMRNYHIERGMSFTAALDKAVNYVAREYELEDRTAKKDIAAPPKPAEKQVDMSKKLELAQKERGKLTGEGGRADPELDIMKMTDDEYRNLSKDAKARLRGDIF